jgi:aminoglycoside/choline kinase family phosphotransferase
MPYEKEIIPDKLKELLHKYGDEGIVSISPVKADASERKLFRLITEKSSYIGVYNEYVPENLAFTGFSRSFKKAGLNVPEIYIIGDNNQIYIEEDLGDTTLFSFSKKDIARENIISKYKEALSRLLRFQIDSADKINYDLCYQTRSFDSGMLNDDIIKFKKYFSNKHFSSPGKSSLLEAVSEILKEKILQDELKYFMYRDFQPRNIMVKDNELYFIDYQSGMKGPLQYDVASFLYSGSIDLNADERTELLDHYLNELEKKYNTGRNYFMNRFYYYVLARLIQVLGSYTYLYSIRNDPALLKKVPKAVDNLESISERFEEEEIKSFIEEVKSLENL